MATFPVQFPGGEPAAGDSDDPLGGGGTNVAMVTAAGEIDLAVADDLWGVLDAQFLLGRSVVLDCSGVRFMDSTGLRTLIKSKQRADEVGSRFELVDPTAAVLRVLDVAGVVDMFAVRSGAEGSARPGSDGRR